MMNSVSVYNMPHDFFDLRLQSGIYFLYHNETLEYIGRSTNILNRLTSHHVFDRNYHNKVVVYHMPKNQFMQKRKEREYIKKYDPPKNINGTIRQSIMQKRIKNDKK